MLNCKLFDKKRNNDILKNRNIMTTLSDLNYTNQQRKSKNTLRKSEKLSIERKVSSSSVMPEILSSLRKDSVLLNSKNSNKSSTIISELKKLMSEERCHQGFWQLSNIGHSEKKQCQSSSSRRTGLSNRLRTHSMSIWDKNSKDFTKSKCKLKLKLSI